MSLIELPLQVLMFAGLGAALVMLMVRIIRGPHVLDRLLSLDMLTLVALCIMGIWELRVGSRHFFDAVLALSIVGFVSTVAVAKYLERANLVE